MPRTSTEAFNESADEPLSWRVQVFARLAEEGFQVTAERVPLSRERAPEAADLDVLQALHASLPPGAFPNNNR